MLDSCINYDKVLDIKKGVASAIPEKRSENNGVFIPSCLIESSRPFFAIDNTDIKIGTLQESINFMGQHCVSTKFATKDKICYAYSKKIKTS